MRYFEIKSKIGVSMAKKTTYELMKKCRLRKVAVPAFNVDNLESVLAVIEAMEESKMPVIFQTIPRTLNYGGKATYPAMIDALLKNSSVDYAIHLDHGNGLELARKCINSGFSSVMYDGSFLSLEDNITNTKEIVDYCKPLNISVEGELGTIGGKEESDTISACSYTSVDEASYFVKKTSVDLLAIGVGTAHGIYCGTPKINVDRISEISQAIPTPLVLHGASGLSDKVIFDCIDAGISKINFATELRLAFTKGIKLGFDNHPQEFDPKIYMKDAIECIKKVVLDKIALCYRI